METKLTCAGGQLIELAIRYIEFHSANCLTEAMGNCDRIEMNPGTVEILRDIWCQRIPYRIHHFSVRSH